MPFTHDVFISYGHLDAEDPAGDVNGWVDLLVERLPRFVSNSLGYQPKIWALLQLQQKNFAEAERLYKRLLEMRERKLTSQVFPEWP